MPMIPLEDYTGYFAGQDGNIYSAWVTGSNARVADSKRKKLRGGPGTNGYYNVNLRVSSGVYATCMIHLLICRAFHGEPPGRFDASHIDGNRANNTPENLCWETRAANMRRKVTHGTDDTGCKNSRAKINEEALRSIREHLRTGELNHTQIGLLYGVSRVFISKINCGHRYKATPDMTPRQCTGQAKGECSGNAKLTDAAVIELLTHLAAGVARDALALRYCVSISTVNKIARNVAWRHVPRD